MKKQYCGTRGKEKRAAAMMQQLLFMGYNANFDTKCTPGFRAGCILCCPGCIFKGWGAFFEGGVHLDKSEFVD